MKVCKNCNQTNPIEAAFCRQCATPLDAAQQNQQQYASPPPQNFGGQQQQWNQQNLGNQGIKQNFSSASGGASSRATQSAILAVVGLLCCFFAGIPAAILGWLEIQAIKEGKSSPAGMTMAQIGLWLGIGGTIINAVGYVVMGFFSMLMGGGGY